MENNYSNRLKFENITKGYFFPLFVVLAVSFLIKIYFFDLNLPVVYDGIDYFLFSTFVANNNSLPNEYSLDNNGWPIFLSWFFSFFNFDSAIQFMQIQKVLSVILSTLTVIPIYFLCKKFTKKEFAIIGASIFGLEPRLIENSLLGATEPLYILLLTTALVFSLSKNKKMVYAAFGITALSTTVRAEGIFLFFALSIIFFIQNKNDKFVIPKYIPALLIFFIILSPMIIYQTEVRGDDRVFSRIDAGIKFSNERDSSFFVNGITNFIKFFGWNTIPIFIFFLPLGIFFFMKKFDFYKLTIIISGVCLSLPSFYAYSIPALDTRYLYPLYPMLSVIAIFSLEPLSKKIQSRIKFNLLLIIIFIGITIISLSFLHFERINLEYENEVFVISESIFKNILTVNSFYPEDKYIKSIEVIQKFPNVEFPMKYSKQIISTNNYQTLKDFIKHNNNLSHIIVDDNINRPQFLKELFNDDKKFTCLKKIYDSSDSGFSYKLKVYEIDYKLFTNCFD